LKSLGMQAAREGIQSVRQARAGAGHRGGVYAVDSTRSHSGDTGPSGAAAQRLDPIRVRVSSDDDHFRVAGNDLFEADLRRSRAHVPEDVFAAGHPDQVAVEAIAPGDPGARRIGTIDLKIDSRAPGPPEAIRYMMRAGAHHGHEAFRRIACARDRPEK